jgi:diguanylate cyclase (GGDEF)-like protein
VVHAGVATVADGRVVDRPLVVAPTPMADGADRPFGVARSVVPRVLAASGVRWRFDEASHRVVDFLRESTGLGFWAVTRVAQGRQMFLTVESDEFDIPDGAEIPFQYSACRLMAQGGRPAIVPDLRQDPAYAPVVDYLDTVGIQVNSYVGAPIVRADGQLFGTLCGGDRLPQDPSLEGMRSLLDLLGGLLSSVLQGDQENTLAARQLEAAQRERDVDGLTGLLNRGGWDRYLSSENDRFRRFGERVVVVVVDLDNLKQINDSQGHAAGDELLRRAAAVLRSTVRDSDIVARLGGDEFGVLGMGVTVEQTHRLVERLSTALAKADIPASFGHASYTHAGGFAAAMEEADRRMYAQKESRRNS